MDIESLKRPTKESPQSSLFELDESWEKEWWGMPEFVMGDATAQYQITVNFMTLEDIEEFAKRLGVSLTGKTFSMWFPPFKIDEPKNWAYVED